MTAWHWLNHAGIAALLVVSRTGRGDAQQATPPASQSAGVEAVWRLEEKYWRLVQTGDVETYRTLWDDGFRGWPCKAQHPATKAGIGDWVRDIRDQKTADTWLIIGGMCGQLPAPASP